MPSKLCAITITFSVVIRAGKICIALAAKSGSVVFAARIAVSKANFPLYTMKIYCSFAVQCSYICCFRIYEQAGNMTKPRVPSGAHLNAMRPIWSNHFHATVKDSECKGWSCVVEDCVVPKATLIV